MRIPPALALSVGPALGALGLRALARTLRIRREEEAVAPLWAARAPVIYAVWHGRVFLLPAVERMLGLPGGLPATSPARLGAALGANGPRAHYMRARAEAGAGGWRCTPFERQDSSLLSVLAEANALMVRPPGDPARREGDTVEFFLI